MNLTLAKWEKVSSAEYAERVRLRVLLVIAEAAFKWYELSKLPIGTVLKVHAPDDFGVCDTRPKLTTGNDGDGYIGLRNRVGVHDR